MCPTILSPVLMFFIYTCVSKLFQRYNPLISVMFCHANCKQGHVKPYWNNDSTRPQHKINTVIAVNILIQTVITPSTITDILSRLCITFSIVVSQILKTQYVLTVKTAGFMRYWFSYPLLRFS